MWDDLGRNVICSTLPNYLPDDQSADTPSEFKARAEAKALKEEEERKERFAKELELGRKKAEREAKKKAERAEKRNQKKGPDSTMISSDS